MKFSIIIPVYNRPQEVGELLESLTEQTCTDFEVIIVEDGSKVNSKEVVEKFHTKLNIRYFEKENGGPGPARNYGAQYALGDYLVFLDSDCITPPQYVENLNKAVTDNDSECVPKDESGDTTETIRKTDVFGGPDRAADDFSDIQKAVNYSMTSLFTTGGIRGGKNANKPDKYFPRSFNMGISRNVYEITGGFAPMRFGEDIDLSYRIYKAGFKCELIPDAYVYHKRRTNMRSFFKQVFFSGMARINLYKRYPDTMKLVYMLPALFTAGIVACIILAILWNIWFLLPPIFIAFVWFFDSLRLNRNIKTALLSVITSFIQLIGYGCGFFYGIWIRIILGKSEEESYKTNFF